VKLTRILIVWLLSAVAWAQTTTTHQIPALDTQNIFSSTNQFKLGIQFGPTTAAALSGISAPNGTLIWVSDAQIATFCITGGSGAWAQRVGGVWNCAGFGGGGGVSGTLNAIPKFATVSSLGNSGLSDDGTTISTSENFNVATGSIDFSAASTFKLSVVAGCTPTANGSICYDSTGNRYAGGVNGSTGYFALQTAANTFTQANTFQTDTTWSGGTQTMAAATKTIPWITGSGAPAGGTCTINGQVYFRTDGTLGQQLYFCNGSGTWTLQVAGGSNPAWNNIQNAGGNLSLSQGNNTSTFTFGTATTNPFIYQDTTGNTGTNPLVTIQTIGTSTAKGLSVIGANSDALTVSGPASGNAINITQGKLTVGGSGTPLLSGSFGATPSTPGSGKSGITFGTSGYIYGSYANDAFSPFARQSDIGGTWAGNALATLPAGVIPDLSGTYVPLSYVNSASGVEGLDSGGNLAVAGLANVSLGTSPALFTAGDYGASPGTAFKITDNSTTSTDTTTNLLVDTGTSSAHIPVKFKVVGVDQFQVVKQPGPQGQAVFGSAVAPTAISQNPFAKVVMMSQTANHEVLRLFQGSTTSTGTMLTFNNATAAGSGFYFWKANPGSSSTTTAAGSTVASLRGDGLFTTTGGIVTNALTFSPAPSDGCLQSVSGVVSTTACGGAGSTPRLDQVLDPNTSKTFALGNNPVVFNSATTTNSQTAVTVGETSAATGTTDVLFGLSTATGSTAIPFKLTQAAGPSGAAAPNAVTVTGGAGGAAANATAAGNTGAAISVTSGAGSAGGATSGNGGAGGDVTITAGNGGNVTSGTNGSGGNINLNPGAAGTGGSGGAAGKVIVGGTLTNASGTFTIQSATNNPISLQPQGNGNLILTTGFQAKSGTVNKYNTINTVYDGLPYLVAKTDLTGQNAAISATTLYATPASGVSTQYKVCFNSKVTTAATTSSTLGGAGGFQVIYTDADDSVVVTTPAAIPYNSSSSTLTLNTTQATMNGCIPINAKASTNIQYQMGYTSSGGTAMQYNLHAWVENE